MKSPRAALWAAFLLGVLHGASSPAQPMTSDVGRLRTRSVVLPWSAGERAPEIYVAARTVTSLRLEPPLVPRSASIAAEEGRFEPPLVGGSTVHVLALVNLAPRERVPFTVTLEDGTVLSFWLTGSGELPDQQVNVLRDARSPEALEARLDDERRRYAALRERMARYEEQESSVMHALAVLMVDERLSDRFRSAEKQGERFEQLPFEVKRYVIDGYSVAVFHLDNEDLARPWLLGEVKVVDAETGEARPFAAYAWPARPGPFGVRRVAVVVERSARWSRVTTLIRLLERDHGRMLWYRSSKL